jgi:hypothetical protein
MASLPPCPDNPEALVERRVCLHAISKDLEGEMRVLEDDGQDCPDGCRTLKTVCLLDLRTAVYVPCDEASALHGRFSVRDLVHAFQDGDGNRRACTRGRSGGLGRASLRSGRSLGSPTPAPIAVPSTTSASPLTPTAGWRAASAAGSSAGATTNTATPASGSTPRRRPPRPRRTGAGPTSQRAHRCLGRPPRAVRPQATPAAGAAGAGLDQPAEGGHRYDTVIAQRICLRKVDTRRPEALQLTGAGIDRVIVGAPQNEALLIELCYDPR